MRTIETPFGGVDVVLDQGDANLREAQSKDGQRAGRDPRRTRGRGPALAPGAWPP